MKRKQENRNTTLVRIKKSIHPLAKIAAIEDGKTLEDWLSDTVQAAIDCRKKAPKR